MRVLMLGDSHLARLGPYGWTTARETVNRAVGGAVSTQLFDQLGDLDPGAFDTILFSVGTNDAGSLPVPLPDFLANVRTLLDRLAGTPVVFVASPGTDPRAVEYDDAHIARYADEAAALVRSAGGAVLDTRRLMAPLGRRGRMADGLHISKAGHAVLIPALRRAVRRSARTRRAGQE
jgi:lysophospholipase L1-like esterase